jgi:hypothetical protein
MPGSAPTCRTICEVRFIYRCSERCTINDMMSSVRAAWRRAVPAAAQGFLTVGAGYAGGFFRTDPAAATPDVRVHFIPFSAKLGRRSNCTAIRASLPRSASCGRKPRAPSRSNRRIRDSHRQSSRAT